MAFDAHKNFAYSTVATAPSPATSGTSLVVASTDGAKFPSVPFNATIWPTGSQPTTANAEIVRVTARSTDTLTITRAQEGSSARTVVVGDQISATITAKTLTDVEAGTVAWVNVKNYGAKGDVTTTGTGGTNDTTAFNNALAALPTASGVAYGTLYVPAGTYRIDGALSTIGCFVSIIGDGIDATVLDYRGSGDCLRIYNNAVVGSASQFGGKLEGFTVDGTGAGSGACGIHAGDIIELQFNDVLVANFKAGSSSIGYHFDNTLTWTERLYGRIISHSNAKAVVFDVTGSNVASSSFGYMDLDIHIIAEKNSWGAGSGVILQNGATIYHGRTLITGFFQTNGSADVSSYVLSLTGKVPVGFPEAGNASGIFSHELDVLVELATDGTTLQPVKTVHFGTDGNFLIGSGKMNFQDDGSADIVASDIIANGGFIEWIGTIEGDGNLNIWNNGVPVSYGGLNVNGNIQSSGYVELWDNTDPASADSNTIRIYAKSIAGRSMPKWIGPSGLNTPAQPAMFQNTVVMWLPGTSTTASINFGTSWTVGATQATPAIAATNIMTSIKRATFTTTTTAANGAGIRSAAQVAVYSTTAGMGGFFFAARFGVLTLQSAMRIMVGLSALSTALAGTDPSGVNNTVCVGKDTGDTNWQIITRSGSANTKTNTGRAVAAGGSTDVFDIYFFNPPGTSTITCRFVDITTGTVLEDNVVLSGNLPVNNTLLYAHAECVNVTGGVGTACAIFLSKMYIESDN